MEISQSNKNLIHNEKTFCLLPDNIRNIFNYLNLSELMILSQTGKIFHKLFSFINTIDVDVCYKINYKYLFYLCKNVKKINIAGSTNCDYFLYLYWTEENIFYTRDYISKFYNSILDIILNNYQNIHLEVIYDRSITFVHSHIKILDFLKSKKYNKKKIFKLTMNSDGLVLEEIIGILKNNTVFPHLKFIGYPYSEVIDIVEQCLSNEIIISFEYVSSSLGLENINRESLLEKLYYPNSNINNTLQYITLSSCGIKINTFLYIMTLLSFSAKELVNANFSSNYIINGDYDNICLNALKRLTKLQTLNLTRNMISISTIKIWTENNPKLHILV
jgi:hypothetical protein